MANLWFTLAVCVLSVIVSVNAKAIDKGFIEKVCDKNDDQLLKDLSECHELYATENNKRVSKICNARLIPDSNGDTLETSKHICKNLSLVDTLETCYKEHNQDSSEVTDMGKAAACIFTALLNNDYLDIVGMM